MCCTCCTSSTIEAGGSIDKEQHAWTISTVCLDTWIDCSGLATRCCSGIRCLPVIGLRPKWLLFLERDLARLRAVRNRGQYDGWCGVQCAHRVRVVGSSTEASPVDAQPVDCAAVVTFMARGLAIDDLGPELQVPPCHPGRRILHLKAPALRSYCPIATQTCLPEWIRMRLEQTLETSVVMFARLWSVLVVARHSSAQKASCLCERQVGGCVCPGTCHHQ